MQHFAAIQIMYTTWATRAPCFGHSMGKFIFIFSLNFIFESITNLWPTLNRTLTHLLLPLARSRTLRIAMALPHTRSRSFSRALFALKCEIILNILLNIIFTCCSATTFLSSLFTKASAFCLYWVNRKKKNENENEKLNLLREHIQRICCFARSHTNWVDFLFSPRILILKKIQATCTKFSPGVVVVVFKSCAQREGAWKTKTKSYLHIYLHIYNIHTHIKFNGSSSDSNSIFVFPQEDSEIGQKKNGAGLVERLLFVLYAPYTFSMGRVPSGPLPQCVCFGEKCGKYFSNRKSEASAHYKCFRVAFPEKSQFH